MRFPEALADTIGDRREEEGGYDEETEVEPDAGAEAGGEEDGERPEDEGPIAFSHRSVIPARCPDEERRGPGELAGAGEHDDRYDQRGRDIRDDGEGQVEDGVGEEIA